MSVDLKAIKTRYEAATPGPWVPEHYSLDDWEIIPVARGQDYGICGQSDAEFIAHAREDIPALIVEIERLRDALHDETQQ